MITVRQKHFFSKFRYEILDSRTSRVLGTLQWPDFYGGESSRLADVQKDLSKHVLTHAELKLGGEVYQIRYWHDTRELLGNALTFKLMKGDQALAECQRAGGLRAKPDPIEIKGWTETIRLVPAKRWRVAYEARVGRLDKKVGGISEKRGLVLRRALHADLPATLTEAEQVFCVFLVINERYR